MISWRDDQVAVPGPIWMLAAVARAANLLGERRARRTITDLPQIAQAGRRYRGGNTPPASTSSTTAPDAQLRGAG
jgi:hypothetical protein